METLNGGIACKQDEIALPENEEFYRAIVENSQDAMLILDDQFRIIYVNETACRVSGFSRQEYLHHNFLDFLPENKRSVIVERYRQRQQGKSPPSKYDFTFVMKDGSQRHSELKASTFRNREGKVWTICQMSDVTEMRRIQQALQKSEERLRRITDNMEDLVLQVNLEGIIEFISPSVKQVLDYEIAELIGRSVISYIHEEDLSRAMLVLKKGGKQGKNKTEIRIRHRDGRFFWFEVLGTPIRNEAGKIVGAVLGGRDVTQRKEIENHLRQSEETFRALTDSTVVAIFVVQGEKFRYINKAFTILSGYTMDDLREVRFWDLIAPEMRDFVRDQGLARQRGEEVVSNYEISYLTKTGETRVGDFGATFIHYEGKPAMIGSISDTTERKKKEEELRASEERYRTIIENIEDGYFEVNLKGDLIFASDPCMKITGTDRETFIGMNFREFSPKENWPKIYQAFYKVYETGEPLKNLAWEAVRVDGIHQFIEVSTSLIRDDAGQPIGFRGIVRDVTDRKQREDKIQWMAYHDILTGLPNRALFYDRAAMVLAQAKRKQWRFGLMMLDLDRFKAVNDTYGHDAGDKLLVGVARCLEGAVREQDTVARIGGDEFVIILPEVSSREDVKMIGERIIEGFQKPISIGEKEFIAAFSMGMALYPDDSGDIEGLMRCADEAMYRVKVEGGGLFYE
ncbi:MAG TPA: PAS domain S-box protein [Smithellaceae bacterium]|nr:PAS domain S-box protein [Smithellaceae bacterium]HRV45529.1 PAS domain S-box protein [Smithellaceae bacterium]